MSSAALIGLPAASLAGGIDLHCHILPGVDDGPQTMTEAVALCRVMAREGIAVAVATPHQLGRYENANSAAQIRARVTELDQQLKRMRIGLQVHCGGEVRLDERIPRLLSEDQILTLNDGRKYLLLELPTGLAFEPAVVIDRVAAGGVRVVLAHAERFEFIRRSPGVAQRWVDAGAILQVNASSLTGAFGPAEQNASWDLLFRGLARIVASDAHSLGQRRPRWAEAVNLIAQRLGVDAARALCIETPGRVLAGTAIE